MYLKRLDMYGFKSFMDKLSVSFDYAITAIVGPNGSGKSNITDAIRWVLGEQSVKSLRGSCMEDVIFAGTAKYKPVSFAEVSLTLDNTSGLFSSPYAELVVTRRVFRNGDSEYFINKTPCRLRDIHELFMDTGLGRDGYSIISQGQIDSILSQKSEDRRQIFEEAAGISKYKYKKNEALRKLGNTEENLVRIRDIAGELSVRLAPLEAQAKKARTYLDVYEKLKGLEINLSLFDIEKLQKEKAETAEVLQGLLASIDKEETELSTIQAAEEALYNEMKDRDAEMEQVRSLLHHTALSIKGLEGDNALLAQRIETEAALLKKLEENEAALLEEIRVQTAALMEADAQIEAAKSAVRAAEEAVEKEQAGLAEAASTIQGQTAIAEDLATAAAQLFAQAEETAKYIASLKGQDLSARIRTLEAEKETAERQGKESRALLLQYTQEKEALSLSIEKMSRDFSALAEKRPALSAKLTEAKNQYNETMRLYNQTLSRKNALSDMEQTMEGYAKGVRAVLSASLSADIRGVLSRLIHVDTPYVTAIETALGGALQNIVVGREEDAKAAIEFLKETRAGRATFLPVSAIRGRRLESEAKLSSCPGFVGLACDLVSCDAAYREIILQLLGTTAIMDTIDHAIAAARKFSHQFKIVTLDGDVLARGGSMSGGSRMPQSRLLGRSEEIAALEKECHTLTQKLQKTEDKIDALSDEIAAATEAQEALRAQHGEKKAALLQKDGQIELCTLRAADLEKQIVRLSADIESMHAQIENEEQEKKRLQDAEADLRARHAACVARTEEARSRLRLDIEAQSRRRDALSELQVAVNSRQHELETAVQNHKLYEASIEKLYGAVTDCQRQQEAARQNAEDLHLRHQSRLVDIEEAEKRTLDFQTLLQKMADDKEAADGQGVTLRADLQSQTERLYAIKNEKNRVESRLEKIQNDLDDTITRLWDAYELTYSAAEAFRKDIGTIGPAKAEAASLRRTLKSLGSVNVDAVTEYAEVLERHTFLTGQMQDLEKAKKELENIIADMTRVMTETFTNRFAEIASHFKDTFRALFGGGTGCLSLSDPQNVLESGIEIDVQPPGKKLQSLSLLSGGEKALTAIAILFAVLQVRPAPFCILDEIESALDDHNIDRFSSYLRQYADTQFIIVTHRRGTMEAADVLYGVTMQEKGLSKLLTMQLADIPKK